MVNKEIIRYDPEVDILTISIREGKAVDAEWLDNNIIILLNEDNKPIEIEIHNARQKGLIKTLQQLQQYLHLLSKKHHNKSSDK